MDRVADEPAFANHRTSRRWLSWLIGKKTLLAVDNTFASPYLQQAARARRRLGDPQHNEVPGGHSDVVGGAVIGPHTLLETDQVLSKCSWRRAGTVRCISDPARAQDAGGADGSALRECANSRRVASKNTPPSTSLLSRLGRAPGARYRHQTDARFRRNDQPNAPWGTRRRGSGFSAKHAFLASRKALAESNPSFVTPRR